MLKILWAEKSCVQPDEDVLQTAIINVQSKLKERAMAKQRPNQKPAAVAGRKAAKQALPVVTKPVKVAATKATKATTARTDGQKRQPRENTKQAQAIEMLRKGTTVQAMADAFGWQRHTTHGFLAGTVKKKLGHTVTSTKVEGGDRVYRIV